MSAAPALYDPERDSSLRRTAGEVEEIIDRFWQETKDAECVARGLAGKAKHDSALRDALLDDATLLEAARVRVRRVLAARLVRARGGVPTATVIKLPEPAVAPPETLVKVAVRTLPATAAMPLGARPRIVPTLMGMSCNGRRLADCTKIDIHAHLHSHIKATRARVRTEVWLRKIADGLSIDQTVQEAYTEEALKELHMTLPVDATTARLYLDA